MTGMEHAIEQAARIIDPDGWRLRDSGTLPLDHPGAQAVVRGSMETARALADAGLLSAAPLREDGVGWYEVIHPSRATTHIAYVHEDGSIYFPEGTQALDTHEFTFAAARGEAHRLVRADAVNRAEGDGSADQ